MKKKISSLHYKEESSVDVSFLISKFVCDETIVCKEKLYDLPEGKCPFLSEVGRG